MMMVPKWTVGQSHYGDNLVIDEAVNHDLYVAGGTVTINAPIRGDLVVAGGTINVNDSVTQDILVAGGNVILNSVVGDDIRCAGGIVALNGAVLGDFVATGGKIDIARNASIFGHLVSSGGRVMLDGRVKGNVKNASGTFTLNGTIERDFKARSGKILINGEVQGQTEIAARTIELGSGALFGKDVRYWNESASLDFKNSLQGGTATYDEGLDFENGNLRYLGFASMVMLIWYLVTALVMIFLIQYLFSQTFKSAANTIQNNPLKSLGLGFLFLIGVPILVVVLFMTLLGIPVAMLTLISYLAVILFATVIVALLISNWLNNRYYQASRRNGKIAILAFGILVILHLISITPFVGPLVMLLLACTAFGAILLSIRWKRNRAVALT